MTKGQKGFIWISTALVIAATAVVYYNKKDKEEEELELNTVTE